MATLCERSLAFKTLLCWIKIQPGALVRQGGARVFLLCGECLDLVILKATAVV